MNTKKLAKKEKIIKTLLDPEVWKPRLSDVAAMTGASRKTCESVFRDLRKQGQFDLRISFRFNWQDKPRSESLAAMEDEHVYDFEGY